MVGFPGIKQLTGEWWTVRAGIPTASAFDRIITPAKGELSKQCEDYIDELVAESLWGADPAYFTENGGPVNTYAMQRGKNLEPLARMWLEMESGLNITQIGFVCNDEMTLGCSPDFLVDADVQPEAIGERHGHPFFGIKARGIGELKVPLAHTHIGYVRKGILPPVYKPQCHGHLVVTGAEVCEFVSWHPDSQFRVTVKRDEYTDKVEKATKEFVGLYRAALAKVRGR